MGIRQNASDGGDARQAHEDDGYGCARHQGVDAVRGLIHFHWLLRLTSLMDGLRVYNARLNWKVTQQAFQM
jgi:hypothetical protein